MRISDWSSDVCSSDLPAFPSAQGTGCTNSSAARQYGVSSKLIGLTLRHAELGLQRIRPVRRQILDLRDRRLQRATIFGCGARRRLRGDRKSVVEGKSVSVRGDLGGRGTIKKKKQS